MTSPLTAVHPLRRRGPAWVLAGALLVAATGCSSEEPADDSGAFGLVSAAPDKVADAGSVAFEIETDTTIGGTESPSSGTGTIDFDSGDSQTTLTSQTQDQQPVEAEQVAVDDTVYLRGFPGTPADQWVRLSAEEAGAGGGTGVTDPRPSIDLLDLASEDVTAAGEEDVEGVSTSRYTGTIDLPSAPNPTAPPSTDSGVNALAQQYATVGLTELPFEVFLDDEGRVVRLKTTAEGDSQGQEFSIVSTITLTDYGVDVAPEAPADSISLAELQEQAATATPTATP